MYLTVEKPIRMSSIISELSLSAILTGFCQWRDSLWFEIWFWVSILLTTSTRLLPAGEHISFFFLRLIANQKQAVYTNTWTFRMWVWWLNIIMQT